jgi:hypothetical protein
MLNNKILLDIYVEISENYFMFFCLIGKNYKGGFMKNIFKILGVISFIAVIGFSIAACGGEEDGSGLTITGITGFMGDVNGKYAVAIEDSFLENDDDDTSGLVAAAKVDLNNETITAGKISGGSVTLKVFIAEGDEENPNIVEYKGNDKISFIVVIFNDQTLNSKTFADIDNPLLLLTKIAGIGKVDVIFKNGTASGSFTSISPTDFM